MVGGHRWWKEATAGLELNCDHFPSQAQLLTTKLHIIRAFPLIPEVSWKRVVYSQAKMEHLKYSGEVESLNKKRAVGWPSTYFWLWWVTEQCSTKKEKKMKTKTKIEWLLDLPLTSRCSTKIAPLHPPRAIRTPPAYSTTTIIIVLKIKIVSLLLKIVCYRESWFRTSPEYSTTTTIIIIFIEQYHHYDHHLHIPQAPPSSSDKIVVHLLPYGMPSKTT